MKHLLVAILPLLLLSGCASTPSVDMNAGYAKFIDQPPTATLVEIRAPQGQTIKISVEGAEFIALNTLLTPKAMLSKDVSTSERMIDGIVSLGKWGIGGYFSSKILDTAFEVPKTVDPVVVNPEIVYVPYTP